MPSLIRTLEMHYSGQPEPAVIRVADSETRAPVLLPRDRAAEVAIHALWHRRDVPRAVPVLVAEQPVLTAFVNDSRWLVQCPACLGAQLTSKADPRFFCVDCLNAHAGGAWLRVQWPQAAEDIEDVLSRRPFSWSRSWLPHESVADLQRENLLHGVRA